MHRIFQPWDTHTHTPLEEILQELLAFFYTAKERGDALQPGQRRALAKITPAPFPPWATDVSRDRL